MDLQRQVAHVAAIIISGLKVSRPNDWFLYCELLGEKLVHCGWNHRTRGMLAENQLTPMQRKQQAQQQASNNGDHHSGAA